MRDSWKEIGAAAIAAGLVVTIAQAGPTWPEGPDAGELPFSAQKVNGPTPIFMIDGTLGGPMPAPAGARGIPGDFQDMFLIKIADPIGFVATTDPNGDGFADFDSQLFLFTGPDHPDGPGLGMFGNDNIPMLMSGESLINNNVDDGSMPPQLIGGLHYFLAISGFDSDPLSASGPIFNQAVRDERSGPDGMGGLDPIGGWTSAGDHGDYGIALQGVVGQTLCPNSDINNDGVTDTADLGILIAQFGVPGAGTADLNGDGLVDTADLGILIATFGEICP